MRRPGRSVRSAVAAMVAAAAALAGVTGCGSPGTRHGHGATPLPTIAPSAGASAWNVAAMPDPCRVASAAEVTAIVGTPAGTGSREDSWPPMCRYPLDPANSTYLFLSDNSQPTGKQDFDARRTGTGAAEDVTGLGDQAYWLPDATTLHVLSGPTHVSVVFWGVHVPADPEAKAVALARLALPRARP
jgi:hypothetical protein